MHRRHPARTGRELEFRHRQQCTPRRLPDQRRERVVEYRQAVASEDHLTALAVRMEAVAQQREQDMRLSELAHQSRVRLTKTL